MSTPPTSNPDDHSHILRPRPQRPFTRDRGSSVSSVQSGTNTPSRELLDISKFSFDRKFSFDGGDKTGFLSRTVSALNLTSSTLFGIYGADDPAGTPYGQGAQTPGNRGSIDDGRPPVIGAYAPESPNSLESPPIHGRKKILPMAVRTISLFLVGVAYGLVISHLRDPIAPVQVETLDRRNWIYVMGWGAAGIALGSLLPWVDSFWEDVLGDSKDFFSQGRRHSASRNDRRNSLDAEYERRYRFGSQAIWTPAIRGVTAFIGIAFAIRRTPWQSTLQVSVTLALVNPVMWYLFDRSKPGFLLSAIIGIAGTVIALGIDPDMVPTPATPSPAAHAANISYDGGHVFDGRVSVERIGVGTWIASVLFCSSLCFGNIGRRLVMKAPHLG